MSRTGLNRAGTRAANTPTPRTAEQALQRRANAVIDAQVVLDADRARRLLDKLARGAA